MFPFAQEVRPQQLELDGASTSAVEAKVVFLEGWADAGRRKNRSAGPRGSGERGRVEGEPLSVGASQHNCAPRLFPLTGDFCPAFNPVSVESYSRGKV